MTTMRTLLNGTASETREALLAHSRWVQDSMIGRAASITVAAVAAQRLSSARMRTLDLFAATAAVNRSPTPAKDQP
ncbi:hypothetical protein [Streptomyces sp. NBC_00503]|uniref:hypothetical protein n=1 Tax=Streptomyces sp. NBC_00503 TaxID=2903659 RepID=UPI002E822639|nr:hypothetical protein [Streptomyces sp. NBC_00503]WUD85706.1 hypothetical protein OG490_37000 [Streptomyces sp. NBC_00503]